MAAEEIKRLQRKVESLQAELELSKSKTWRPCIPEEVSISIQERLQQKDTDYVKELITNGTVSVHDKTITNQTLLSMASCMGNYEITKLWYLYLVKTSIIYVNHCLFFPIFAKQCKFRSKYHT